jgi:hypothetical protein
MDNPHNEKIKRNEQVIELDRQGISRAKIARQMGISRQRVLQICGAKYAPGREGDTKIPPEKVDDLRMKVAKYELSIKDVAKQYETTPEYTRFLLVGFLAIRKELNIGKCCICKGVFDRSEMYRSICHKCNAKRTTEYYREHREHAEDSLPCKECGMLVSQTYIGKFNHMKWHERQQKD